MASGKKNYFRHSFNAFEDEKIQVAIDKLGYEGYAFYFILIEILAKHCENEFKNPIKIHQQTLRSIWRKQTKSCLKVVRKLEESGLFVATFTESFVEFDMPNLAKYLGKYQTKCPANVSNKKKVKEKKVKEEKLFDFESIYLTYPKKIGKASGMKKLKTIIKNDAQYNLFKVAVKNYIKHTEGDNLKYIKQFSTFVNSYEDYTEIVTEKNFSEKISDVLGGDEWQ